MPSDRATRADVERASELMYQPGVGIERTPVVRSRYLSEIARCEVFMKLENFQVTGSYKARGAFNMLSQLPDDEVTRGVITASAGNHAQGVAFAAQKRGVAQLTKIVMAKTASRQKVSRTAKFGVTIIEAGVTYDEAKAHAEQLAERERYIYVPAFDDWNVIAGQGTVAKEVLEQVPDVTCLVAPVGGGGLMAGSAIAMEGMKQRPRLIGVEAEGAASFALSFQRQKRVQLPVAASTIADGIAVRMPGQRPWEVISELGASSIVTVPDTYIAVAMAQLSAYDQIIAEGAGAAAAAALLAGAIPSLSRRDKVVIIISGGNVETHTYQHIINYALLPPSQLFEFRLMVQDGPGHLVNLLKPLHAKRLNVVAVDVLRWHPGTLRSASETLVSVVVELPTTMTSEEIVHIMGAENYHVQPMPSWSDPVERL